ncbi:MAG: ABC transporter substrate-binding protein [Rhodospirillaceae bacterium]|jgi:peptide/nickel transport system substrate-binding protein|nr:ABC transporter substrate-binding protein [Rhodospirillaceae bacterium]MBT5193108.1 ABC transporter substrate-binding protein [Rhodospirillaceae bacterium]MBT5899165.1 ABC transporter substrate-binding protein [Rhodospirillaceae bacterium]
MVKFKKLATVALTATVGAMFGATMQPQTAQAAPKAGGTLVWVSSQVPRHFNPAVQSGVATMAPGAQLFGFLVRADENWNIHPYLAESWTVSDDGLTVAFKLRKGAKFHDGQEITSADVAFSVATQQANHPFKTSLGAVERVETPDPMTAVFKLKQPHPALLLALSTALAPIIPKHVYGDGQDVKKHPRNVKDLVGSGPFLLKEYKKAQHVIMLKNPNFNSSDGPYLDRIIIKIIRDASARVIAMEKKEAQIFPYMVDSKDIRRLSKSKHIKITDKGYAAIGPVTWLAFNTKDGPTADVRVRQAIAYAIDRNFIINALHGGLSKPATGPIAPGSPFYNGDVETYDFDLDKAKALLDEAGLKPGSDGMRFKLEVDHIPAVPEQQKAIAEYLRPALKKVGIAVRVRNAPDFPTWAKRISGHQFQASMDIVFNWGDPVIGVHRTYLCNNIKKGVIWSNTQQYCNPKVDSILEMAGKETDMAKRVNLYGEFQRIVADDLPLYWINIMPQRTAYHMDLGNPPTSVWGVISPMDQTYWKKQPK